MIGATLAVAVLAVGAFLLTNEANLRCVEGELQDNQVGPDGEYLPRTESFTSMADAEAFVCRRIPQPRDTAGAVLTGVSVTRTTNLGKLIEKEGGAVVDQQYASPGGEVAFRLQVVYPRPLWPDLPPGGDSVSLRGQEARLLRQADTSTLYWTEGDFFFTASSSLDLESFLAVLKSLH